MDVESKDTTSEESSTSTGTVAIVIELYKSHKNKIKGLVVSLILALLLKVNFAPNEDR